MASTPLDYLVVAFVSRDFQSVLLCEGFGPGHGFSVWTVFGQLPHRRHQMALVSTAGSTRNQMVAAFDVYINRTQGIDP